MSGCRPGFIGPLFGAMGEARALPHPLTRRRRRGFFRSLPLRLLALVSLGLVIAAAWWVYHQWEFRGATVPKVAAAAAGLPTEPAPKPADGMPGVLDRAVDTIAFPDLKRFGWRAIGARSDDVAGRVAVTVYYAADGRQLRYTIVPGTKPVDNATALSAQVISRGPRQFSFVMGVPDTTLVFRRAGRTVVLTEPGAPPAGDLKTQQAMMRLATFRAGGRLAF
jgi:hypothetical protein